MQIDKNTVIEFLQGEGKLDQAQQAVTALPEVVDLTSHAQLLEQIGVDPSALSESLSNPVEAFSGIRDHLQQQGEEGLGGVSGIIEKLKGLFTN